ncbi:MAG: hypothetical protein ACRELX_05495 [Longimicrobiales bacterium]
MHIALTDVLSCPRCGPEFGLILLADRVEDRRVLEGVLGCANCREKYAVRRGFIVLHAPGDDAGTGEPVDPHAADQGEAALRAAALMGVSEGPALLLVAGPAVRWAPAISALVEGAEVIAASPGAEAWPEQTGVSRITVGARLPFYSGKLQAAYLSGDTADRLLEETARALSPIGRLVLSPIPSDVERRLAAVGLRALARDEHTLVAARG